MWLETCGIRVLKKVKKMWNVVRDVSIACHKEHEVCCGHERCGMLVMKKTSNVVRDVWNTRLKEHDV